VDCDTKSYSEALPTPLRRGSQGQRVAFPRLMVVGSGAILLRTSFALDIGSLPESIAATGISM